MIDEHDDQSATSGSFGLPPAGYRLPAAAHVGAVRLQVADVARSRAYYESVIGLSSVPATDADAALGVADDGRVLVELVERPGARRADIRRHLGLFHFAVLLPDRASLGRFVQHLADTGARVGAGDHLVSEAFYLTDPDGLGIEVYADRPREAWRRRGRELVMTTEAVDVEGLLEAAGGEPWTGVPSGTRMGHVHLHVADLDRAAAFYGDGLGLDRTTWSYPGALFLSAGGYHHHVGVNTWAGAAPPPSPDDAQLLAWTLHVPGATDVDAVAANLAAQGHEPTRTAAGLRAVDPWGTPVLVR